MHNPLISVIMPIYNVESYLSLAINSVLSQTYSNIELLLIDDGSTDNSGKICDEYALEDKRVRVFHKDNGGQAEARNLGIDESQGEWLAFLDADDCYDIHMFELLIGISHKCQSSVIACKTRYFYDGEKIETDLNDSYHDLLIYSISEVLLLLLTNNVIRFEVWNKLWKKELIGDIRFKPGQIGEEVYFDFEVFKKTSSIAYTNTVLHHYLVSRDGNTNSRFRIERMCIFEEFESYIQYLLRHNQIADAEIVACIATMFCISVYLEAVDKRQSVDLRKKLRHLFFHFSKEAGDARKYKRRAIALFTFSPALYNCLLKRRLSK